MNAFLSLGRWFFVIPFALLGILHFMDAGAMVNNVVPSYMPAKLVWVYIAGAGLIAASVSMLLGKWDKLAATLLAVFLLLLVAIVHAPNAVGAGSQSAVSFMCKDLALAGAAMMYALNYAKDRTFIG